MIISILYLWQEKVYQIGTTVSARVVCTQGLSGPVLIRLITIVQNEIGHVSRHFEERKRTEFVIERLLTNKGFPGYLFLPGAEV